MRQTSRASRSGSTIVEFAFSLLLFVPLTIGVFVLGFNVTKAIQVAQVARDAGHMFARGMDFSVPATQEIVVRLAAGLNMTRTSGDGTVIFSRVVYIGHDQCQAGGLTDAQCTNINWPVFTRRMVVGNPTLAVSAHGTPASVDSSGNVQNYLTNATARALGGFGTLMPGMAPPSTAFGAEAFMVEAYFASPGLGGGVYSRSIF